MKSFKLMLILDDYLTNIVHKGEVVANYYNPGDIFNEVHIILINNDCISENSFEFNEIQKMVGTAKLFIYNFPKPSFFKTFGWNIFMGVWYHKALKLAEEIEPDVVRTYNNFLDAYLAYIIKNNMKIPYIISLHDSTRFGMLDFKGKLKLLVLNRKINLCMKNANKIIAVYYSIFDYANQYNDKVTHLLYNSVNVKFISRKVDYDIDCENKLHLLNINRQIKGKNPKNIIKAISNLNCDLTIIGDGALHIDLIKIADKNTSGKVFFIKNIPNNILCSRLFNYDLLVSNCDYVGISKSIIEAAWAGLPIIINKQIGNMKDFEGNWVYICEDTEDSYRDAILQFANSKKLREEYGKRAYEHAKKYFDAETIKKETIKIYYEVINKSVNAEVTI